MNTTQNSQTSSSSHHTICSYRGHSLKLKKNRFRTELRQHFFSERVINIWNKLDEDTVCASSLTCFKHHIQKLYQDGSFHRLLQSIWPKRLSQFPLGRPRLGVISYSMYFGISNAFWFMIQIYSIYLPNWFAFPKNWFESFGHRVGDCVQSFSTLTLKHSLHLDAI